MRIFLVALGLAGLVFPIPGYSIFCQDVLEHHETDITLPFLFNNRGPRGEASDSIINPHLKPENEAARVLSRFGFRVRQNPHKQKDQEKQEDFFLKQEQELLNTNKTPDYLINGRIFDHYAPVVKAPYKIVNGIRNKALSGQTHRVVVDLRHNAGFQEGFFQLTDILYSLRKKPTEELWEVLIVHGTREAPEVTTIFPEWMSHSSLNSLNSASRHRQ